MPGQEALLCLLTDVVEALSVPDEVNGLAASLRNQMQTVGGYYGQCCIIWVLDAIVFS